MDPALQTAISGQPVSLKYLSVPISALLKIGFMRVDRVLRSMT